MDNYINSRVPTRRAPGAGRGRQSVDQVLPVPLLDVLAELDREVDVMLVRTWMGLVSGYGAAQSPPLPERARAAVHVAVSDEGLITAVRGALSRGA